MSRLKQKFLRRSNSIGPAPVLRSNSFGVYVLQSISDKSAEEVFGGYKNRWGIEAPYQYMKNKADFNNLMV